MPINSGERGKGEERKGCQSFLCSFGAWNYVFKLFFQQKHIRSYFEKEMITKFFRPFLEKEEFLYHYFSMGERGGKGRVSIFSLLFWSMELGAMFSNCFFNKNMSKKHYRSYFEKKIITFS